MARIALAVLVAGCGSTVPGTAVRDTAGPPPAAVDPGALNTGTYPTTPPAPLGNAGSYAAGRLVEGRRMAGYVVGPWQVDPALTRPGTTGALVIENREQLGLVVWPAMLTRFPLMLPLVVGFATDRKTADPKDPTSLRDVVLRFADADAAKAAADGMTAGALAMPVVVDSTEPLTTEPIRAVPIPGHPDINGALLIHREGDQALQELTVTSAHGPYVLLQVAETGQGPDRAAALAGRALDLQGPLIDQFRATDPAQFPTLPLDPTGLLAFTLPLKSGQGISMADADYDPAGALQLEYDPIQVAAAFTDAGVDAVSTSQTTVYEAKDPDGAQRLAQALGDVAAQRPASQPAAPVPGLPQSRCVRIDDSGGLIPRHWCIATADRFAFKAIARQLDNAHQQMAAQYRILAG